jgi:hypothetical protein
MIRCQEQANITSHTITENRSPRYFIFIHVMKYGISEGRNGKWSFGDSSAAMAGKIQGVDVELFLQKRNQNFKQFPAADGSMEKQ